MILLGIDKKGKGGREGARPLIAARGCDVACLLQMDGLVRKDSNCFPSNIIISRYTVLRIYK